MEILFTAHTAETQEERDIAEEQILDTISNPTHVQDMGDGTVRYYREITVGDGPRLTVGRYVVVVLSADAGPLRVITVYPSRKIR